MLNAQKGNMYKWITDTRNPLGGKCFHDCSYCYVKSYPSNQTEKYKKDLYIDEKELRLIKGNGKFIFICNCNDLFAEDVPKEFILRILEQCRKFDNKYLFQTKNPKRFFEFLGKYPNKSVFGVTIETNEYSKKISKAPDLHDRFTQMVLLPNDYNKMVSIEPIMDFDLKTLVYWIKCIGPEFVSIGADSKGHKLPEPSWSKVERLIKELKKFTEVRIKSNLKRLLNAKQENS